MSLHLVRVVWEDAWTNEMGVTVDDVGATHKPTIVTTIGWLLRDDSVGVSLANEMYEDQYRGRTFIPRGMVKDVSFHILAKPRTTRKKPAPTVLLETTQS